MLWTTVFPKQSHNLEACALLLEEKVPKADEVKFKAVTGILNIYRQPILVTFVP